MNSPLNRYAFFIALFIAVMLLLPYEWYWKNIEHYAKSHNLESLDHWADQRTSVSSLSEEDVIILGSSRVHFDINIHLWDSLAGRRPLQLAYPGSSPYHPIEDIVNNTDFNGLLVIGVAPGLFFTTEDSWGASRGKVFVDHYQKRTYAQTFNQRIFYFIDPHFSYIDENLSYRYLIDRLPFKNRDSIRHPDIWPPMVSMDKYRNIRMTHQMETDTIFQRRQKDIWFNPDPQNRVEEKLDEVMDYYIGLLKKFQERGGKVAFIRAPVAGYYLEIEPKLFPRKDYWDRLIEECKCVGYHFQDHPVTNKMEPPEWSHLSRKQSDIYTKLLVEFLQQDGLI